MKKFETVVLFSPDLTKTNLIKLEDFLSGDAFYEINENLRIQDQEIKLKNLKDKLW